MDPYSFTHLLHGFVLCGLLAWFAPRLSVVWQLWIAVSIEALWEVAIWIRDNLSLNVLMLIHPIDAIKEWQAAAH